MTENHRFTVIGREPNPKDGIRTMERRVVSQGKTKEKDMPIKYEEGDEVVSGTKSREVMVEKAGDIVSESVEGAVFRWDMLHNLTWHTIKEVITLKETEFITNITSKSADADIAMTKDNLIAAASPRGTDVYVSTELTMDELQQIYNESPLFSVTDAIPASLTLEQEVAAKTIAANLFGIEVPAP